MNRIRAWWERRNYRRQLDSVRDEIQAIWDKANDRREPPSLAHVRYEDAPALRVRGTPDRWRPIEDYMKKSELNRYDALCSDEWALSTLVGVKPEWGYVKHLSKALGEDSPPALMTVKEDRSTKISYEYVELVDMMVKTINGKWSSNKSDWERVEGFKRQGWGRPADFNDYLKRFHDAKTPEETEAVLNEYREKYPNAIY